MLSNIQILRAFAAINVVIFHVIGASLHYKIPATSLLFMKDWGQNGVDIFFVISGFIMVYIQEKKNRNPLSFFKDRVQRIVPIYWLLTFIFCCIYFLLPKVFMGTEISLIEILTSLFFISNWFGYSYPVLMVGWTLELEMIFYLIFAFCLFFKNKILSYFLMSFLIIILSIFTRLNLIMMEFLLGMICRYFYLNYKISFGFYFFIIGSLSLLLSIFVEYDVDRFFVWGIPSFFVVLGLLGMVQYKNKFLEYLGNASYSIYLVQILAIPLFYKISVKYLYFANSNFIALTAIIFTILVSCLFYSLIEKNIIKYVRV